MLATLGKTTGIKVYSKPKVGLLSTGNELVSIAEVSNSKMEDGKIRDSNKLMFKALIRELNLTDNELIVDYGIVRDEDNELNSAFEKAVGEGCDIIVTSGGVSMGEMDLVKPYIESHG